MGMGLNYVGLEVHCKLISLNSCLILISWKHFETDQQISGAQFQGPTTCHHRAATIVHGRMLVAGLIGVQEVVAIALVCNGGRSGADALFLKFCIARIKTMKSTNSLPRAWA